MDGPLVFEDDLSRSPAAPSGSEDLDSLPTFSGTTISTKVISEYSEAFRKSVELLPNVSKYHNKENCTDCHSTPDCFSLTNSITEGKDLSTSFDAYLNQTSPKFISDSGIILTESSLEPLFPPIKDVMEVNYDQINNNQPLRLRSNRSDSLESDSALEHMTELYIFESETQDFILRPSVEPQEINCPEYQSLAGIKEESERYCNTKSPCESLDVASQCHHGCFKKRAVLDCDSYLCGYEAPSTTAGDTCESESAENKSILQVRECDSQVELWLDACQYLTYDNPEGRDILEQIKLSVTQDGHSDAEDLYFPQEQVPESGYIPDNCDRIGWSVHENRGRGPPVQRWSSVDSWTTALSDWTGIISAQPVEISEIGVEIGALTQAIIEADIQRGSGAEGSTMGVQDQPQNIQQNSILSFVAPASERSERDSIQTLESLCWSKIAAQEEIQSKQHPSLCFSGGKENSPALFSGSTSDLEFCHFSQYDGTSERDEKMILNIIEDTDVLEETCISKKTSSRDTERNVIQASGTTVHQIFQPGKIVPSDVLQTLTIAHVFDVDTKSKQTHTLGGLDGACQVEPEHGGCEFMMPSTALRISSSLWTSSISEPDHIFNKRSVNDNSCAQIPCNGNAFPLEGDKDLKGIKEEERSSEEVLTSFSTKKTLIEKINDFSRDLSNLTPISEKHFKTSEENRVAVLVLDIDDPFVPRFQKQSSKSGLSKKISDKMPNKTHKKDKSVPHPAARKQDKLSAGLPQKPISNETTTGENQERASEIENDGTEGEVVFEMVKPHSKKKKKHGQHADAVKPKTDSHNEVETAVKQKTAKGRIDMFEAKITTCAKNAPKDGEKKLPDGKHAHKGHQEQNPKSPIYPPSDDIAKRRRLSEDKFGKIVGALESKLGKLAAPAQDRKEVSKTDAGATRKKTFSEVVKQKTAVPKEEPKVVQPIQVLPVSGDPQSLCLWCQFTAVFTEHTVTWRKEGATLAEFKRSAGDESRVLLNISNASHKDLGKYQCCLQSSHGSATLDYLLTYEVLSEVVIPLSPTTIAIAPVQECEEEDVSCSRLMFKEDFLKQQFFGENHDVSIVTEKAHFGEGMHRRAFRTKLQTSKAPMLLPGHSCVLKVHNAISYGTKNSEELITRNFTLAVEECHVQNTAREFIKAYTAEAQGCEAFGKVPEIIPIFLVHRPSNDIPYATLEEELIGDFVKYSVKDGKEINLMRRDSEAGRKCCAFQHWVYSKTEGNLLVTDMQGVGMRLTDVGIATCKKGYKGFKGNCSTSFIDQFKALHQCNTYCEILGLISLQPKAKKPAPKAKPQASVAPKKKVFGPTLKGKS